MKNKRLTALFLSFILLFTVSASAEKSTFNENQKKLCESAAVISTVLPLSLPGTAVGRYIAEGLNASHSAGDETQAEADIDEPITEGVTARNYYNSNGTLLFMENYLYYDNGLPCARKLSYREYYETGFTYDWDIYSALYLYNSDGSINETIIDAGYNSYDENTGVISFSYRNTDDNRTLSIAPEEGGIEQEKYGVAPSKTEEITGALSTVPFKNTDDWADFYLDQVFTEQFEIEHPEVGGCTLIMLDDDNFPEFLMRYEVDQGYTALYTKSDSDTLTTMSLGNWNYIPHSGMALCRSGKMGTYFYGVYRLENGVVTMLDKGAQNAQLEGFSPVYDKETESYVCDYKWNDEVVDKETFESCVQNALGDDAVEVELMLSYEQCNALLHHIAEQ